MFVIAGSCSVSALNSPSTRGKCHLEDKERKGKNDKKDKKKVSKGGEKNGTEKQKAKEGFTLKGAPLGLRYCQCVESELAPLSRCQSTQCCPGGSLRRGMKVSPSSRAFSQKAPSPRTLRWMTRCSRSPWGIRSYTSWERKWG